MVRWCLGGAGRKERDGDCWSDGRWCMAGGWCPRRPGRRLGVGWRSRAKACVHRCRRSQVLRCVGAIGAAECWGRSAMRRLLSTSQTATRRVGQASAAVPCWKPWMPCWTRGHCCAGVINRRLVPMGPRLRKGYLSRPQTNFHTGRSPFPFSPPKHVFLTLFYLPPPLFVPIQVVDANPGVPAHSAYPQHQR